MAILLPLHTLPFLAIAAVVLLGLWLLHCIVHSAVAPATLDEARN
jgi:hypothetical protein